MLSCLKKKSTSTGIKASLLRSSAFPESTALGPTQDEAEQNFKDYLAAVAIDHLYCVLTAHRGPYAHWPADTMDQWIEQVCRTTYPMLVLTQL